MNFSRSMEDICHNNKIELCSSLSTFHKSHLMKPIESNKSLALFLRKVIAKIFSFLVKREIDKIKGLRINLLNDQCVWIIHDMCIVIL